jgi:glycosyltransferase involved in cell wall biosynthesis
VKVCIFTETYYPVVGGGETQARLLAEGLLSKGHSVTILTRRSDATLQQYERYGDVNVYRLAPVGGGQLNKWGLLLSSLPALIQLRNEYDLIFVSGYRIIGLTAILVGKLFRKPVVLKADSQGEMSGEFFESGLRKFHLSRLSILFRLFLKIRNFILQKADAFSAVSAEIASEWTSNGVPPNKIHLIPNGVDTTRFTPANPEHKSFLREQLKLPKDAIIAIYTGRLVSYKGLPLLLKVWDEICCKHKNAILLLAGTGGLDMHNCEADLREYVASAALEKEVIFLGAVQNVSDYLQASDLFVFPTENEAFGVSVVEAMACALPVIATSVGGLKNIIAHKEDGILIQAGIARQLFEALDLMISDPALRLRLGQTARLRIVDRYSIQQITRAYISVFQATLRST